MRIASCYAGTVLLVVLGTWHAAHAATSTDLNADGVVNQADFQELKACRTGPAIPQTGATCRKADFDDDGDVDHDDFGLLQRDLNTLPSCGAAIAGPRCTDPTALVDLTGTLKADYRGTVFNPTTGEYRTQVGA